MELEKKKTLEESIEQTLAHQSPDHVKIKQKWSKRKQRHPELNIDVHQESDRVYREFLKQIQQVTTRPLTEKSHLTIEPEPHLLGVWGKNIKKWMLV